MKAAPDNSVSQSGPSTANHVLVNGAIKTVATSDIGAVPYAEPGEFLISKSGDSNGLAKLDASALESAEPHDGLSLEEELALVHRSQPMGGGDLTSPVNELSLAAELSDLQEVGAHNSEEVTPVNEKSLEEELLGKKDDVEEEEKPVAEQEMVPDETGKEDNLIPKLSSSVVSDNIGLDQDDILIFDTNGEQVTKENGETSEETSEEKTEIMEEEGSSQDTPVIVKLTEVDKLRDETQNATPGRGDSIVAQARGSSTMATPAKDISDLNFKSPDAQFDMLTTSTPKKGDSDNVFSLTNPMGTLSELHGNSEYYTALSAQISTDSTNSTPSLPSTSTDDRSFLGEKKFAAMLQTVVTSFDNEEDLMSASLGEMSFEAIPEEISEPKNRDLNATPTDNSFDLLSGLSEEKDKIAVDEDTFIMDQGEGENTKDGEIMDSSKAFLLDLGDLEAKKSTEEGDS